jgi:hypothetical protein
MKWSDLHTDRSPALPVIAAGAVIAEPLTWLTASGVSALTATFGFVAVACRRQRARLTWLRTAPAEPPSRARVRADSKRPALPVPLSPACQPAALSGPHSAARVQGQVIAGTEVLALAAPVE